MNFNREKIVFMVNVVQNSYIFPWVKSQSTLIHQDFPFMDKATIILFDAIGLSHCVSFASQIL